MIRQRIFSLSALMFNFWFISAGTLSLAQSGSPQPLISLSLSSGSGYSYGCCDSHPWPSLNFQVRDVTVNSSSTYAFATVSLHVETTSTNPFGWSDVSSIAGFDVNVRGNPGDQYRLTWSCVGRATASGYVPGSNLPSIHYQGCGSPSGQGNFDNASQASGIITGALSGTPGGTKKVTSFGHSISLSQGGHRSADWTVNVAIEIVRGQQPPTARIVGPSLASVGVQSLFDGSTSSDPDGTIAEYKWTIQKPSGTDIRYGSQINYSWSAPGTYQVQLTVTDNEGLTGTAVSFVEVGNCAFTVFPPSTVVDAAGELSSFTLTASSSSCAWTASPADNWITVTAGSSGNGNGTVQYSVSRNSNNYPRSSAIVVPGQSFRITQRENSCQYSVSPLSASFSLNGGTGQVAVTPSRATCSWTAASGSSWITIAPPTGVGNGTVRYSVGANLNLGRRVGSLTVAGQRVVVTQEGDAFFPTISVSPASLDFGRNAPQSGSFGSCQTADGAKQMRLVVKNIGPSGSSLSGSVGNPDLPFAVVSGGGSFTLAGGESRMLLVSFDPVAAGTFSSALQITSNDPSSPSVTVPVSGEGNVYAKLSPLKGKFGQFYYCDVQGEEIQVDPAWVAANIVTVSLPVLGQITCHRSALPNFQIAVQSIQSQGLAGLVHSVNGVYNPRYQRGPCRLPTCLSNHSWGSAIDINAGSNPFGSPPSADNINLWNLVFKDSGFFWGVDFSNPTRSDPMHFEVIP